MWMDAETSLGASEVRHLLRLSSSDQKIAESLSSGSIWGGRCGQRNSMNGKGEAADGCTHRSHIEVASAIISKLSVLFLQSPGVAGPSLQARKA